MFMRGKSNPILFADDTSILVSHSNLFDFKNNIKFIFTNLNELFTQSLLYLNFTKMQFTNFTTKNTDRFTRTG